MPKMIPLKSWVCDSCHQLVGINDGWLEWLSPQDSGPHSYRICHNRAKCQKHTNAYDRADMHIREFLEADGLQSFLSNLDIGPLLDPDQKYMPHLPDMRSFVEAVRRLQIPFYEEARLYFDKAIDDGYFADQNEVGVFLPQTCKAIIAGYE